MIEIVAPESATKNEITLPGSKYIANRLMILAALTEGQCQFDNVPVNDDINVSMQGLSVLGAKFNRQNGRVICSGFDKHGPVPSGEVYTSHSGTFSRFVVAVAALASEWVAIRGSDKMNTRPMADLLDALREAGVSVEATAEQTLPLKIKGPLETEVINISGAVSSQYISALLLIGARLPEGLVIQLSCEPVSKPFLAMTIDLIELFGGKVTTDDSYQRFEILPNQQYQPQTMNVPADPSSASYFLAYAAIMGSHVCLQNYRPDLSLQGEAKFSDVLEKMGCKVWQDEAGFHCQGPDQLTGVSVDMGDMPDVVQTLVVVAAFANGKTEITNIENLAFKESNRIEDTATELRKTGLVVTTTRDSMIIEPGELNGTTFDTYDDHRMAMSLALMSCRIKGIRMRDHEVVSKSFPTYWDYLDELGFQITESEQE